MDQPRLPATGKYWSASIKTLALAYGHDEDTMAMAVYAVAEQVHVHYCLNRGLVLHNEARPDQQVAVSILMSLAGQDWWMVRSADIRRPDVIPDESLEFPIAEGQIGLDDAP